MGKFGELCAYARRYKAIQKECKTTGGIHFPPTRFAQTGVFVLTDRVPLIETSSMPLASADVVAMRDGDNILITYGDHVGMEDRVMIRQHLIIALGSAAGAQVITIPRGGLADMQAISCIEISTD